MRSTREDGHVPQLFPKLMKSKDETIIVLFKRAGDGVVVWSQNHDYLGNHSATRNMEQYMDFYGKVTLS